MTTIINIQQLAAAAHDWGNIQDRFIQLAEHDAFNVLGYPDVLFEDSITLQCALSYTVSVESNKLIVTFLADDYNLDGTTDLVGECPADWFFKTNDELQELVNERNERIKENERKAEEAAKREKRRQEYLKLKAEFEPETANEAR